MTVTHSKDLEFCPGEIKVASHGVSDSSLVTGAHPWKTLSGSAHFQWGGGGGNKTVTNLFLSHCPATTPTLFQPIGGVIFTGKGTQERVAQKRSESDLLQRHAKWSSRQWKDKRGADGFAQRGHRASPELGKATRTPPRELLCRERAGRESLSAPIASASYLTPSLARPSSSAVISMYSFTSALSNLRVS